MPNQPTLSKNRDDLLQGHEGKLRLYTNAAIAFSLFGSALTIVALHTIDDFWVWRLLAQVLIIVSFLFVVVRQGALSAHASKLIETAIDVAPNETPRLSSTDLGMLVSAVTRLVDFNNQAAETSVLSKEINLDKFFLIVVRLFLMLSILSFLLPLILEKFNQENLAWVTEKSVLLFTLLAPPLLLTELVLQNRLWINTLAYRFLTAKARSVTL